MALIGGRPVGILGTGIGVPDKIVDNKYFETIVDTSDEWIVSRSGIHERRISEVESCSELAARASLDAMRDAGISAHDVDMVIVGTNSPDTLFPGVGPTVQGMIGAERAGGMDIQAGCPGALFGMVTAAGGIAAGLWEKVIVAGSEVITPLIDQTDRSTCVLFGDGAGACVMGTWHEGAIRLTHAELRADGTKGDFIILPAGLSAEPATEETVRGRRHFVQMNGREVFKFVNRELPDFLESFCTSSGTRVSDIDHWIFHQANVRIIESVSRRINIPPERVVINLNRYGNTSAASVMIALHEVRTEGKIQKGDKIVIVSFGAGMTYGALLAEA